MTRKDYTLIGQILGETLAYVPSPYDEKTIWAIASKISTASASTDPEFDKWRFKALIEKTRDDIQQK